MSFTRRLMAYFALQVKGKQTHDNDNDKGLGRRGVRLVFIDVLAEMKRQRWNKPSSVESLLVQLSEDHDPLSVEEVMQVVIATTPQSAIEIKTST